MPKTNSRQAWLTTAALCAGAMLALSGGAAPAYAAPVVDGAQDGSLTIHKFEKNDTASGLPNNGTAVNVTGHDPLAGVEFTIQQVQGIDLTTNQGWLDADDLSTAFAAASPRYADQGTAAITSQGRTLAPAVTATTDSNGGAFFTGMDLGLYLVTETSYPAGVTPSAPFLVTVPLTDPDSTNQWLYDVHVYPKNSLSTADKTVSDAQDIKLGDEIDFTITADIPNEDDIDGYRIVDDLDAKLDYVGTQVSLSNGATVTEGTHFTVAHEPESNTVTVDFTDAGRAVLAQNQSADVIVELTTTVNTVGEIANQALVYPNTPSFGIDPGEPGGPVETPEVVTKWGNFDLQKVNAEGVALSGAEFSVYASEADALAGTDPIELAGQTVHTVGLDGGLTLSGLRYSNWADGKQVSEGEAGYQSYWLVETKAPEGYELLAAPIEFTVTADTTSAAIDLEVENVLSNAGFELPMTGGPGTGLLYVAGGLLVTGAAMLALRTRRNTVS